MYTKRRYTHKKRERNCVCKFVDYIYMCVCGWMDGLAQRLVVDFVVCVAQIAPSASLQENAAGALRNMLINDTNKTVFASLGG